MMVISPGKKNSALGNYAIDDRKSARCLAIIPSFFTSKKETKASDKQNTNEKESFRPDGKTWKCFHPPEADQKKIAVEVKPDNRNSKNDKIKISTHETKDVESLTNLMQNLSPSLKRSYDGTFQKSMANGSVGDETNLVGNLRLRDKLSKTATPPGELLISSERSPKPDDSYAIQARKKRDMTPKDFQKWEESFRIANKKGDDMILLREIRRSTIKQFRNELENLIQLFIRCGRIIETSSRDSSD
ncbi:hypothetical protein AVEN_102689-1 [Araneus ventricosus]|uniref:Uncharacterized protein n=1 Tax=Araneus ventricosus TaxID=182803 RepID=A0A4Y2SGZ5_ARAVE|nr:hypothetical protein AVEN_102689-1 [Araneus ventricosus]